jgi:uncharacterized membrane protein YtjA (UPF0391 family)
MQDWWSAVSSFEKIFWFVAVPSTVLTVMQMILTFFGIGDGSHDMGDGGAHDGDVGHGDAGHGDAHGHSHATSHVEFKFLTIRNLMILASCFGWAGIAGNRAGFARPITVIFALMVGCVVSLIVAGIFYLFMQLRSSGNMDIRNALDGTGTVYLPIPAEKVGAGMIQLPVQGSIRELSAMTEGPALTTGTKVKVVSLIDSNTVLVVKM